MIKKSCEEEGRVGVEGFESHSAVIVRSFEFGCFCARTSGDGCSPTLSRLGADLALCSVREQSSGDDRSSKLSNSGSVVATTKDSPNRSCASGSVGKRA